MPILVRASVFDDVEDRRIVTALVDDYVNPLLERGFYLRTELPAKALQAYHVDYYMAQVANGGHGQFMGNSGMKPLLLGDVREGLRTIGLEPYISIFNDMERLWVDRPERARAIAGNFGFGDRAKEETSLDDRFFKSDCYKTLMPANGRWIKSWPELKILPDDKFRPAIEYLILENPRAEARMYARRHENLSGDLSQPLQVATQMLGRKLGIVPLNASGIGDPSAKAPDGRNAMGWHVSSQQQPLTMFLDEREAVLCERYLADGRKLTYVLMNEIRQQLLASKDLNATRAFTDVTHKEIGRLPVALIDEAIEVTKRAEILAAAALACQRLKDELQSVSVMEKSAEGMWIWRIQAKAAHYFLALPSRDMLVINSKSKPMFALSFSEVEKFARFVASGSA